MWNELSNDSINNNNNNDTTLWRHCGDTVIGGQRQPHTNRVTAVSSPHSMAPKSCCCCCKSRFLHANACLMMSVSVSRLCLPGVCLCICLVEEAGGRSVYMLQQLILTQFHSRYERVFDQPRGHLAGILVNERKVPSQALVKLDRLAVKCRAALALNLVAHLVHVEQHTW